jgi:hypothetical protein
VGIVAARPRLVHEHEHRALRLELSEKLVDVVLPGPDRPQRHHLGAVVVRCIGDGDRVLVDVETNVEKFARLFHG